VFVHGTRLSRGFWAPQVRRLAGTYRCVTLDLPGHGTRAAEAFTIEAAAAAVAETIEAAVPGGRAVVVGLSLGGYVAIEAAYRFPDRVAGLVLAGCSAEPTGPVATMMRALALALDRTPRPLLRTLNLAFFRARYRRSVAGPIIEGGFWWQGGAQALRALLARRYLERLGRLWVPVLVVNGALDPVFGPGGEPWAAACRSGRHAVIPWAGHLSNLDRPATFSARVAAFARSVAAAS
jgi:pimeloyl-ACP methyl ester carboxylesterase